MGKRKFIDKLKRLKDKGAIIEALQNIPHELGIETSAGSENTVIIRFAENDSEAKKFQKEKRDNAARGRKVLEAASEGGKTRKDIHKSLWDEIQKKANSIWQSNPALSRIQIAKSLKKKNPSLPVSVSTIRQRIRKP